MAETLGTQAAGRWWEYYTLRYFVGTVVGVLALIFLAKSENSRVVGLGVLSINDLNGLGLKEATALGAAGFAYCYIASAPMLLLHAVRGQLGLNPLQARWRFWAITGIVIASLQIVAAWRLKISWHSYRWFGSLVFLVVVGVQFALIVAAHLDRFKAITSFYYALAQVRSKGAPVAEYVESYRHLREHGNSLAILVLEFALAYVLVSAQEPALALIALILWLVPSIYSWFIGSLLEASSEWRQ